MKANEPQISQEHKDVNTTTLLFSLKGLEILYQERRGQLNTIVMEHFNSILLQSRPANKQYTYQSTNGACRFVQ
jgi:hypothetical protein